MSAIEVIFAATTLFVVGLIGYMLRSAYRLPDDDAPQPILTPPQLDGTPANALERYIRGRIEDIETPAITLALKSRLEIEDMASEAERRLLYFELMSDLERIQPGAVPQGLRQSLDNVLAQTPASHRDGVAMAQAVAWIRKHLGSTLGSARATQLLADFPAGTSDERINQSAWNLVLRDGSAALALHSLLAQCTEELGKLEGVQILERAAREVGSVYPLSCLKGFLAAFPVGLLSAEKASASARDRIWDEFLAARKELDMARLRLAEADMNKWASVGRLAAGMAHEINNPLLYIVGNLELLRDDLVNDSGQPASHEEQMDMISDVMEGLEQIRNIVRDLQVFSRTRRDQRQEVDLGRVIASTIKVVKAQAGRGLEFHQELSKVPTITADESKIGQILLNLLINASHASTDAVRESVTVRSSLQEDRVVIEIEDQGGGIPAELQDRIFEPFFTTKEIDQGTGLGLAISREIAEQHGGSLTLDASYSEGARFRLALPLGEAEEREQPQAAIPTRTLNILFVDDDPGIRKLAERGLGKTHTLTLASDGAEAQAILQDRHDFDVVVLDLQLPKLDGGDLFAWLEREHPQMASNTLIMTGGPTTARAADFLSTHANQTLNKPATQQEIEQAILRIANTTP